MKTPVVVVVFNRPDVTKKLLRVIKDIKPQQLFVIADGPRPSKHDEIKRCSVVREIVTEGIDWECEVSKNFSDVNLGCAKRVSSGLDWVFSMVEAAIILEDDCIPHPTFFQFCEEMLERYRRDDRITAISGQNVQFGRQRGTYSYYFSRYNHCWGWASWRRAWKHFDFDMKLWPQILASGSLEDILGDPRAVNYWTRLFEATYHGRRDSWAYRWLFACWVQNGLTVLPNVNLVSNIGFGVNATNTVSSKGENQYSAMPAEEIYFPLKHPPFVIPHRRADEFTQNTLFNPSVLMRARAKALKLKSNMLNSESIKFFKA